jgi:hypothetical protein
MTTIHTSANGCGNSSEMDSSRTGKLTADPSSTCDPKTSQASPNAISSAASSAGLTPLTLLDGLKTDLFGLEAPPASPTPSLVLLMVERKATAIREISGRISQGSSGSATLLSCLVSRLRARSGGDGGIEPRWTWKRRRTPLGRLYYEQMPLERPTRGNGSTGWPSPAARDGRDISRSNAFLSQQRRHSPSMATRLLERNAPWTVITAVYCLAMGYPSSWNEARLRVTETPSCPSVPRNSSPPSSTPN